MADLQRLTNKALRVADDIKDTYAAGQKAEYDRFWDAYQDYGNRGSYAYAFFYPRWTDATFNPKYNILVGTGSNGTGLFQGSGIVDTQVDIDLTRTTTTIGVFKSTPMLKTIRKIIIAKTVTLGEWFYGCSALENITFEGEIGNDIDLHWSPLLTVQSLLSILTALSKSPETATGKTATFALASQSKINADSDCLTQYNAALAAGWTVAFV